MNSYNERCRHKNSGIGSALPHRLRVRSSRRKRHWSAIALGVTEDRRKAIRRHRVWRANERHTSTSNSRASPVAHATLHFRSNTCGVQQQISARAEAHALSVYFSNLPPRAANDGNRELVARGESHLSTRHARREYCSLCRLPWPQRRRSWLDSSDRWARYTYLKRRLEQWAEGYHGSLEHPMPHIATQLSRDQIEELASYLSFVR